jgi:cytochrome c oxidase cbb3-type subunit 3/ubiquinol-cytochrome c reductase cytochrome c subunit
MMKARRIGFALAGLGCLVAAMTGCRAPGKPGPEPEVVRPEEVLDFATLYRQNCAACHGDQGQHGVSISLANPVYLALAGRDVLVSATAKGGNGPRDEAGKLMPAYAKSQGGSLTDRQIEILADGMERNWGRRDLLAGEAPPPYAATLKGDAAAGEAAFGLYCGRCHRASATAQPAAADRSVHEAGPVTNPSFLALITDQSLRTTILAGRPEDGMPDWRGFAARPLTDQQVTDIVAWLATRRQTLTGDRMPNIPGASQGEKQ